MKVRYGNGSTQYGPGVLIELTGDEVALAISSWLHAKNLHIDGARTILVNGAMCAGGEVHVDPSARVIYKGDTFSGRGAKEALCSARNQKLWNHIE